MKFKRVTARTQKTKCTVENENQFWKICNMKNYIHLSKCKRKKAILFNGTGIHKK